MSDAPETDLDAVIQRVDPDRWLSSRFIADAQARADAVAVYAFDYELARAPKVATNPLIGEIRLTWWREVLDEAFGQGPVRKHPAAEALAAAIRRHSLPREPLEAMIDARYRELDAKPLELDEALNWARNSGGSAAVTVARILDPKADEAPARAGGEAWAIGRLMGTMGLNADGADAALAQALKASRGLSVTAFPAIAHGTLARVRARGRKPGDLGGRVRMVWAVLIGRI